jgi:uracil-DNA glycosylase
MSVINPRIEASWKAILLDEFNKDYFKELKQFLLQEKQQHIIYPSGKEIFNAFNCTPFEKVKVVILGQDPYHGKGQAHGLSFSVPFGIKPPPSLKNIFKELKADLDIPIAESGNLTSWAKQGVLLLNATLTVRAKQAGSHQNKGWGNFTDAVISSLSENKEALIFLLWGKFAQNKTSLIDSEKHHILTAAHPSPFSAYSGFFGCKHFSKTNEILNKNGLETIDWKLQ